METALLSEKIANEWEISNSFDFDNGQNKELELLYLELSDSLWSKSGEFNDENIEALLELFGVTRGEARADRVKLSVDKESLKEFIENTKQYENKEKLLYKCKFLIMRKN